MSRSAQRRCTEIRRVIRIPFEDPEETHDIQRKHTTTPLRSPTHSPPVRRLHALKLLVDSVDILKILNQLHYNSPVRQGEKLGILRRHAQHKGAGFRK